MQRNKYKVEFTTSSTRKGLHHVDMILSDKLSPNEAREHLVTHLNDKTVKVTRVTLVGKVK